jgi:hypothetical protein
MKQFAKQATFIPLQYIDGEGLKEIKNGKGKRIEFKTQKAVENYCLKNRCIYVKHEDTFYR